ncbi:energy transducer TonB [Massilia niabensis]|uniref:TonB family protein n=1 Tax=Massilia niabensis TaxID=544910 RepID=A0ABW0L1S2_9BURK
MHFAHLEHDNGSKAGKFALVAGLHALIAVGVVNMMNNKGISMPSLPDDITVFMTPKPVEPLPPPLVPPTPMPKVAPPQISVPKVEIDVPPPPMDNPVRATMEAQPLPEPAQPYQAETPPQPTTPSANSGANMGAMRSAVLADASGCAKPEYPISAARNGDTGTVTLALLVGTDGRVTGSRVQKSSGSRDLDRAAVNALSLCQFKPAMNNGVAEAGWAQIAYVWSLE